MSLRHTVRPIPSSFFALLILTGVPATSRGADASLAQKVRTLNNEVLARHGRVQSAHRIQSAYLRADVASVLEQRISALESLAQEDPQAALSLTFSEDLLADLSEKFPNSASLLESHGAWEGAVERFIIDGPELKWHRTVTRLKVGDQSLEVHFAVPEPSELKSGVVLRASGVQIGSKLVLDAASVQSLTATAQICSTTGVQNTAVLIVNFPGYPSPSYLTPQNVYASFFGTTGRSLDGYWREASYGKTSATGNVFGPFTLSTAYFCTNFDAMRSEAITLASNAGVNFQNYTRVFIIAPDFQCGWSGLAEMGCGTLSSPAGPFTASTSWINGTNWANGNDGPTMMAVHEGGHNLGLNHSNSRGFGTEVLGPLGTQGTITEYGDNFTAMTNGGLGHYSAPQKVELLNWLGSSNYQVVQNSGTWTLQPFETSTTGLQTLKIQRGTGNNAWLWLEYRQPVGNYDNSYVNNNPQWYPWANQVFSGAVVHYEDSFTTSAYSHLLDFTPTSGSGFWDPALSAGQTWTDPYSNLSLTIQSATASGMTVSVNYGAAPCAHANPTVTVSPSNPSISAGGSVNYTVAVTNKDASGCPASTLSLTSSQPSGWLAAYAPASVTLNPGQTASTNVTETVPAGTAPGTYALTVNAVNGAYTGSGSANATVVAVSTLTDSVSVPATSYSLRQTVPVTASVQNGGVAVAGASVAFTMSKPSGSKFTGTATTDATGKATWSYKLSQKDPVGAWSVATSVSYQSQIATSNSVTFTVR